MKLLATVGIAIGLTAGPALAQDFPKGTVTIIIPFGAGGSTDILARRLAVELSEMWGKPVIVENRPGAGSMIGATALSQALPDGHTLMLTTAAMATGPAIHDNLSFNAETDITPITMVATSPYLVVGGLHLEANSLGELVEIAGERPIFVATAGAGSSSHFTAELLIHQAEIGADIVHFSGGNEANTSLAGGHADVYISNTGSVMPFVENGQVKPLGVLGSERFVLLPDIETSLENGIEGLDITGWISLFGPGDMDANLVELIDAAFAEATGRENVQEFLTATYLVAADSSHAEFREMYRSELGMARELVELRAIGQ